MSQRTKKFRQTVITQKHTYTPMYTHSLSHPHTHPTTGRRAGLSTPPTPRSPSRAPTSSTTPPPRAAPSRPTSPRYVAFPLSIYTHMCTHVCPLFTHIHTHIYIPSVPPSLPYPLTLQFYKHRSTSTPPTSGAARPGPTEGRWSSWRARGGSTTTSWSTT